MYVYVLGGYVCGVCGVCVCMYVCLYGRYICGECSVCGACMCACGVCV